MKLGIIVPAFRESTGLLETQRALDDLYDRKLKDQLGERPLVVYIDDGSTDDTWEIINQLQSSRYDIHALSFSRNFGHQAALLAGLEYVVDKVDVNVCIDADLQHDIEMIPKFIDEYNKGTEIVYGIKNTRGDEKLGKKIFSLVFYKLLKTMGAPIIENHADFRLMGKKSTQELLKLRERNLFLRGTIPSLGFKSKHLSYDVKDRCFGESKYCYRRMFGLALNGITSFGVVPLRLVTLMGLLCFLFSGAMTFYAFMIYFKHSALPGWASIIIPIYFLGGIQLLGLGIIGEYAGKIYLETKHRPHYIIEKTKIS